MSSNFINASVPKKKDKKETSPVEMELFLTIIMDGLPGCNSQKTACDIYRGKRSVPSQSTQHNGLSVFTADNPKAKPSEYANQPDDETHIHKEIYMDLKSYLFTPSQYNNTLKRTKLMISQVVEPYCMKKEVKSIKLHCFYIGYNTGDFIMNILHSFDTDYESQLNAGLKKIFGDKRFLKHPKIKYKALETVYLFEPLGIHPLLANTVGAVVTMANALTSPDNSQRSPYDVPLDEDVVDAAVLCQHTYYSQTDIQQSVWKWVSNKVKSIFSNEKKRTRKIGTSIKYDFDYNKDDWKNEDINYELVENADRKWTPFEDPFVDYLTGFYAKLYKRNISRGGKPVYAFCTCGTNFSSPVDWIFTNILQGLCGFAPQYTQSVTIAKALDKKYQDSILFFIGHSLGGGLASNNALVTRNRHAITFNAAGLSFLRVLGTLMINNPADLFHVNERKSRVHAFVIEGEVLNFLLGNDTINIHEGAYGKVTRLNNATLNNIKGHAKKHGVINILKLKGEELNLLSIK